MDFFSSQSHFVAEKFESGRCTVLKQLLFFIIISEFTILHLLRILKWMSNCSYEQELQLHFVNFYTKSNCLQYSQRRPVQDSSKSNTIHSRCVLQISSNEFFTFITFIFFLVFFTAEWTCKKQVDTHTWKVNWEHEARKL